MISCSVMLALIPSVFHFWPSVNSHQQAPKVHLCRLIQFSSLNQAIVLKHDLTLILKDD